MWEDAPPVSNPHPVCPSVATLDAPSFAPPNLTLVTADASSLDPAARTLTLASGRVLRYDVACVATGARPRVVHPHPAVRVLRDTDSIAALAADLRGAGTVVVAGNGGIALGLAGALTGVDVVWAAKHAHVGDAFFDADAAAFLAGRLRAARQKTGAETAAEAAPRRAAAASFPPPPPPAPSSGYGAAVGPGWADLLAAAAAGGGRAGALDVRLGATVTDVASAPPSSAAAAHPLLVTLSTGAVVPADAVVSAIGVDPDTRWLPPSLARAPDGGLWVDADAATSAPGLYAAGDAATVRPSAAGAHWFQMRLWTQARALGALAGAAMAGVPPADRPMALELFTHATSFCGVRAVLLGRYNGQGLEGESEHDLISYSTDDGASFARVLLCRGRVAGAILLGDDTERAGVLEDLILDGVDVSFLGAGIVDPDLDLDAIFD